MRYLIDTTKDALALRTKHYNVIVDNGREPFPGELAVNGRPVIALCPITDDHQPICEGAFSFAPLVQRALENDGALAMKDRSINAPKTDPDHPETSRRRNGMAALREVYQRWKNEEAEAVDLIEAVATFLGE